MTSVGQSVWCLAGETGVTPQQIPHDLSGTRTLIAAEGNRPLTVRATARSSVRVNRLFVFRSGCHCSEPACGCSDVRQAVSHCKLNNKSQAE
jgi:hypothetical protein